MRKYKQILIYSLLVLNTTFIPENAKASDSTIYKNAYEYILNSDEIKKFYKKGYGFDSLHIKVSSQILREQVLYFLDEISDYEFSEYNTHEKDSILDKWKNRYYAQDPVIKVDTNLNSLNTDSEFKLLLFFSEIKENRLYAVLEVYNNFQEDYDTIIQVNQTSIVKLLFYYNENNSIEKVFIKYLAR